MKTNKNKMMNVARNFDIMANVFSKIIFAVAILFGVVALLILIFGDRARFTSLNLDFIKLIIADSYQVNAAFMKPFMFTGLLTGIILCLALCWVLDLFRKILAPMKEGRPFEDSVPQNLKKIAWISLAVGAIKEILDIVAHLFMRSRIPLDEIFSSEAIAKVEYSFEIDLTFVVIFCIIMLLSYIFSYGQELQKESDETL